MLLIQIPIKLPNITNTTQYQITIIIIQMIDENQGQSGIDFSDDLMSEQRQREQQQIQRELRKEGLLNSTQPKQQAFITESIFKPIPKKVRKRKQLEAQPMKVEPKQLQYVQFDYPQQAFKEVRWANRKQIMYYLRQNYPTNFNQISFYKPSKNSRYQFQVNCKVFKCNAVINYDVNTKTEELQLKQFNNHHVHPEIVHQKKGKPNKNQLSKYIEKQIIPQDQPLKQTYVEEVALKFDTTTTYVRTRIKQMLAKTKDQLDLAIKLLCQSQNCEFIKNYDQTIDLTTVIMMVTKKMKDLYFKFGDCIFIEIFNEEFQRTNQNGKRWKLGFVLGLDTNFRCCIFAIFMIAQQNYESYLFMIRSFFNFMGHNVTETLFSEEKESLTKAIDDYRIQNEFEWNHMHNYVYKVRQIKKQVEKTGLYTRVESANLINDYLRIHKEAAEQQKYSMAIRRVKRHSKQTGILERLLQNKEKYFIKFMKPSFIGYQNSIYISERIKTLLSAQYKRIYSKCYVDIFIDFLKLEKILIGEASDMELAYKGYVPENAPQFLQIRQQMEKKAFVQLANNYYKTTNYNCVKVDDDVYEITMDNKSNKTFKITYNEDKDCWDCQCTIILKYGIPCPHLLKLLRKRDEKIKYYIRERWLRNDYPSIKRSKWKSKY